MPDTQPCPCICHIDPGGILHTRTCCPEWVGDLDGPAGESLPHIAERIARRLAAMVDNYPVEVFTPGGTTPDAIGAAAMRHAYAMAARIAREAFPKGDGDGAD